jgi:hypothetical protein
MKEVVFASNPSVTAKDASNYESQSVANLVTMTSLSRIGRSNSLPTGNPAIGKSLVTNDGNSNSLVSSPPLSTVATLPLQSSVATEDTDLRLLSDKVIAKLKTSFDMFISTQPEGCFNTKDWPMLDWVINEFLPRLLHIIIAVPPSHHSVVTSLVEVFFFMLCACCLRVCGTSS